jgi:hypothetical protein
MALKKATLRSRSHISTSCPLTSCIAAASASASSFSTRSLADRRVRGEFKSWRDSFAETPRKADYAWKTLARIMSFAKDRGIIATNPCERGGRLYVADRRDKIWTEQDIAAVLSVASKEIQLALILPSRWRRA